MMRIFFLIFCLLLAPLAQSAAPHDFFQQTRFGTIRINGRGDLLLYTEKDKNDDEFLVVHDMAGKRKFELLGLSATSKTGLNEYGWLKDDVLYVRSDYPDHPSDYTIYWPVRNADGKVVDYESRSLFSGYIVDGLRDAQNEVLVAQYGEDGTNVYRIDYTSDFQLAQYARKHRLNNARLGIDSWLTDHHGNLAFGVDLDGQTKTTWFSGMGKDWRKGFTYSSDVSFSAYDIDYKHQRVLALSNHDGGRIKLAWWRLADGGLDELVYEDPNVDISGVLLSGRERRITGVQVYRAGQPQTVYLHAQLTTTSRELDKEFPGQVVSLVDSDDAEKHLVLYVGSAKNPGEIHLYDTDSRSLKRLAVLEPRLEPDRMAEVKVIKSRTSDGVEVESFLAMPYGKTTRPLLVMPHGGPLNVRDSVVFNREVQYLASRGYAVLQTNYRGSAGYGKQFLDSGRGQWGRGIEQDIRAAVAAALREPGLDPARVCVYGASYGGYSALMNAIQTPELFKCAASFAGVTDLPLMFANSAIGNDDELRQALISIVGNPDADRETLKTYSPVYQYKRLKIPLFIAQGTDDGRVDLEHAKRLTLLLDKVKTPYTYLEMEGTRHGFLTLGEVDEFYNALDKFLATYLKPEPVEGVVRSTPAVAASATGGGKPGQP